MKSKESMYELWKWTRIYIIKKCNLLCCYRSSRVMFFHWWLNYVSVPDPLLQIIYEVSGLATLLKRWRCLMLITNKLRFTHPTCRINKILNFTHIVIHSCNHFLVYLSAKHDGYIHILCPHSTMEICIIYVSFLTKINQG